MGSEAQQEELEVLRSIYEGDTNYKEIAPTVFQYKYGDEGSPTSFLLEINWPENYPDCLPEVNMEAFYNKHLKPGIKQEIKSKILAEAEANIGCAMTYTLVEWVKEHIEDLFANYSDEVEAHVESMDNLNIADKGETKDSKETKERKVILTKAQKRRQWDKMDGKGEKPRGYDWVDVIKHLSQTGPQACD